MNCPGCKARNPIGNKFCRECGQKLPLEENKLAQEEAQRAEQERARERAAQLLTRAFALSQHGKPAEALPLAEEAASLLPGSTSALTLCSTLYERLGQNDRAIAMMERVVALNPQSTVDADKLERLRRGVHLLPRRPAVSIPEETVEKRRWLPLAAGLGAGVLVMALGIAFSMRSFGNNDKPGRVPIQAGTTPPPAVFTSTVPLGTSDQGPLSPPAPPQPYQDPFVSKGRMPLAMPPRGALEANRAPRTSQRPVLPDPRRAGNGASGSSIGGVPPVTLSESGTGFSGRGSGALPPLGGVQGGSSAIPAAPPTSSIPAAPPIGSGSGGLAPGGGTEAGGGATTEGSGYIRIREHSAGNGEGRRASESAGNARSTEEGGPEISTGGSLLRAQTLQASGRYREAIVAFREALSEGASAGDVQQGVALCHQRLGEKAPARAAYQQAISAFEAQVRAGRGSDQASRGIAACRAALDVLGNS